MHGGTRDHLCPMATCKRAYPGHGFDRPSNLRKHVQKLHIKNRQVQTQGGSALLHEEAARLRKVGLKKDAQIRHLNIVLEKLQDAKAIEEN